MRTLRPLGCVTVAAMLATPTAQAQSRSPAEAQVLAPVHVIAERPRPPPERPLPRNVVYWQPLSLIFASWDLEYERVFERHVSASAAGRLVFGIHNPYRGPGDAYVFGGGGELGVRVYPWGRAPSGFFLQPYTGLISFNDEYFSRARGFGVRVGLLPGYTFLIARIVSISIGNGFEYIHFTRNGYTHGVPSLTVRLAIGIAF